MDGVSPGSRPENTQRCHNYGRDYDVLPALKPPFMYNRQRRAIKTSNIIMMSPVSAAQTLPSSCIQSARGGVSLGMAIS